MATLRGEKDRSVRDMLTKPPGGRVEEETPGPGQQLDKEAGEDRVQDRQEVTGVRFGGEAYTIVLYTDDVVVKLDDPVRSLSVFLEEVEAFGAVSGFQVNLSKSRALDLAPPGETGDELTQHYQWEDSSVPYLGLRVARTVMETASVNYRLLLQGVRADLAEWRRYPISWTGRIAAIKMSILPRALFLFQRLPVEPPSSSVQTLQREINSFIWGG
ncbi:hypothetical protein NDU88_001224 [Pleurodeles waltl]|uniref:Reverse transcriptase domain-containing protein n=1 Tax=Pleurodeles waltl TaxID=8319 RepID=A0AAV7NBZ7_PLEWA|nr:hypothetical protein NDU88_001224 [Pleurodeles waltl]